MAVKTSGGGMGFDEELAAAHAARERHRFTAACAAFEQAARSGELSADDHLAWSDAAWWTGDVERCLDLAERGHRMLVADGEVTRAAREAISLGFLLLLRGELTSGAGWMQRGRSTLAAHEGSPDHGYAIHLDAEEALDRGEFDRARELAHRAHEVGQRADDATLTALAKMTEATALVRAGSVRAGMATVDEAMLPVRAGEVRPEFAGNLYCQTIALCWELGDLDRARQWTDATERWCGQFDSAIMFSGICRMHRVQLDHVAGDWDAAAAAAELVCTELAGQNVQVVAEGHYLLGDLLRLRGRTQEAEAAYLRAHELGREPEPGLALLAHAAGDTDRALRSLLAAGTVGAEGRASRAPVLRATVVVAAAAGARHEAERARDELTALATAFETDALAASAAQASGTVARAAGQAGQAVAELREAVRLWQRLGARHEGAVARTELARAYRDLGDGAAAAREVRAAERTLVDLGAVPDLAAVRQVLDPPDRPAGLTAREAEVLAAVARGGTNRDVAGTLFISERTVARHLANVFPKIGVTTRTAAAHWARRHGIT